MIRLHDSYKSRNREQVASEDDDFTVDRYKMFQRHFPAFARSVLDIGCNTGRDGSVLKERDSELGITGLDRVQERLDRLPPASY